MKIYISSSWKNREIVRDMAIGLRSAGHKVYDFTDPACRETKEIPPELFPEEFNPKKHNYKEYLTRPEWFAAVWGNRRAIDKCDAIILLLPCGIDATADWAYGVGKDKFSIIVGCPKSGERHPTHLWADIMVDTTSEAVRMLSPAVRL